MTDSRTSAAIAACVASLVFGGIAFYGARTGKLPVRSGRILDKERSPRAFTFGLACYIAIALFALCISLSIALQGFSHP